MPKRRQPSSRTDHGKPAPKVAKTKVAKSRRKKKSSSSVVTETQIQSRTQASDVDPKTAMLEAMHSIG